VKSWEILGNTGKYWEILGNTGKYPENPGNTPQTGGKYWEILGKAEKYWEILGNTGKYWKILINTGKYPENPGNTPQTGGRYWEILGKAGKYWEISLFAKLESQKRWYLLCKKPSRDALFSSREYRCFTFRTLSFTFPNLFWVRKYRWHAPVGPCATPPTRTGGAVALRLRARLNPASDLAENTS